MSDQLHAVSRLFAIPGDMVRATCYGSGHINDTYLTEWQHDHRTQRIILQRINTHVFQNPAQLMENITRITQHHAKTLDDQNIQDASRRCLHFFPSHDGLSYACDEEGNFWRSCAFIDGAIAHQSVSSPRIAYEAAKAFGDFQAIAARLDGPRLHETIPHFHHTRKRYESLIAAAQDDVMKRRQQVLTELDFVAERAADCSKVVDLLKRGIIPERVTHNDTKINNVLLDETSGEGLCVIDLDTTMPGCALYDFGDLVRTIIADASEDAKADPKMALRMDFFQGLVQGYLQGAHFLTETEKNWLAFSGKLITLECGIRFLTDFLEGDHYFKTTHPQQNLFRARNQFALVAALEREMNQLEDIVHSSQLPTSFA
ncbi:MAG: hypothetical protein RL117_833 [Verrucomicrobiota bacterium]|jgi:hypothetical protein